MDLEYLAIRHGRIGSQFVYEVLFDLDTPEAVAHVGLIDIEQLRRELAGGAATLAGFGKGVAGQNGHLAGGDEMPPPPVSRNRHSGFDCTPDGLTGSHIWRCEPHGPSYRKSRIVNHEHQRTSRRTLPLDGDAQLRAGHHPQWPPLHWPFY